MGTDIKGAVPMRTVVFVSLVAVIACSREAELPVTTTDTMPPPATATAHLQAVAPTRASVPVPFELTMRDTSGAPTALSETGGEPVHVIAVRKDLSWLRHAHPQPREWGSYTFDLTFPREGTYAVFAVLVPVGRDRQTLRTEVVIGDALASQTAELTVSPRQRRFGPYNVRLTIDPAQPLVGEWSTITFHLERSGAPVTNLHSDFGSGHLAILDASSTHFVYAHSTDGEALRGIRARTHQPAVPPSIKPHEHRGDDRGPDVQFHALFPAPGRYKVWAEFAPGEEHLTAEFVIEVGAKRSSRF